MSKEKTTLFTLSIVVIISLLCSISSCSKEDYELTDCSTSELSTKEQFAELLSAAITNSEELRFLSRRKHYANMIKITMCSILLLETELFMKERHLGIVCWIMLKRNLC